MIFAKAHVESKCEGRNCLDLEHYKLGLHREL